MDEEPENGQDPRAEGAMAEERAERAKAGEKRKPLWKSKLVLAAGVLTITGLAMWVYALATAPPAPAPGGVDSSLVSGFAEGAGTSRAASTSDRLIDSASPAVLRFGGSFLGGCVLAYVFKKFIKVSLIITGLVAAAVYGLHRTGVVDFDADAVKGAVDRSFAWAKGEAAGFKDFIVGYLPSSVSACAGLVYGAWKA